MDLFDYTRPVVIFEGKLRFLGSQEGENKKSNLEFIPALLDRNQIKDTIKETQQFIRMARFFGLDKTDLPETSNKEQIIENLEKTMNLIEEFFPLILLEVENEMLSELIDENIKEF